MADVDLYGGDAERIRNQYRQSLGRDASDQEVQGWLSGSYGGGNTDSWLQQIAGSHEAQQYQPPTFGQPNPNTSGTMPTPQAQDYTPWTPQPTIDPWEQARQGLTSVYRNSLGRDPGEGDIDKWLSGGYGYGSGLGDYDKYVAAIMGSHEARTYRPAGTAQPGGYQNLEWWQQQGTPAIDIFDPMTGQLKPGWSRTAKGYERTGGAAQTTGTAARPSGGYQGSVLSMLGGGPSSPQALAALEPELNKLGIRLQKDSFGNIRGRLYMPDGSTVDVVPPGGWGQPWTWIDRGTGAGHSGGPSAPGDQYSDAYTKFLEQLMKARIAALQGGVNDPYRNQLLSAYQNRANQLGAAAEPEYQALVKRLEDRFGQLQGPGYTGAENEAIRTGALDPIESDRAAAKKRVTEQLAARGITLESGVAQQALLEVDKAFDSMRAQTQTTLTTEDLNRREGRQQRADAIKGSLYDVSQGRAREQLDVFSAMDALSAIMREEENARQREAIGYGGALADLGPQRLQLAMQAAGMGGNPSNMFQNLMQLAQLNQQSSLLNQNRSAQWYNGLGSIAAILMNAGR